jgi:pimeloyl-ACP methyl ester carboxylesterase
MQPTFFGRSDQPLYGVLHPPVGAPRDTGVVLFYPGLQEYDNAHWALRSLATSLALRGFHVLRFDYRGMGDSAGEPEDATLDAWVDDARLAYDEIRDASGVSRVSFVGLRLGAVVAAQTAATADVESLFLWEPIVSGATYLEELEFADAATRLRLMHPSRCRPEEETGGYFLPRPVRDSIARVDLVRMSPPRARRIAAFVARPREDLASLQNALDRRGRKLEVHVTGGQVSVSEARARQAAIVAGESVATIAAQVELRAG